MAKYYIASCVFTSRFPELSFRIRDYVEKRFGLETVRCCVPKYKLREFTEKMPEGIFRERWSTAPDCAPFQTDDEVYSLCHNCNNIIEETHPGIHVRSLWELLDMDGQFPFPDHTGMKTTVQDCWRSRDRKEEQDAVRSLLRKMHIDYEELSKNRMDTDYCGPSLYRPQPERNPKLAPKHYVNGCEGKFLPHTEEEQVRLMEEYCKGYPTPDVVCYCHYCLEGLRMGKVNGYHIAELLFPEKRNSERS